MSLIFDALKELETQPARAESFAFAPATRQSTAQVARPNWRLAGVVLLLVAGAAATMTLYARRANETVVTPLERATQAAATSPTPEPADPGPLAVPTVPPPVSAAATPDPVAAALPRVDPVSVPHSSVRSSSGAQSSTDVAAQSLTHEPADSVPLAVPTAPPPVPAVATPDPVAAALPRVVQASVPPPSARPSSIERPSPASGVVRVESAAPATNPRRVAALSTADDASVIAPRPSPPRIASQEAKSIEAPVTDDAPRAAATAASPAPAAAGAEEVATANTMSRPVIENPEERQRIVVSSARAVGQATPADEVALQRRVASFTEAMQRKEFDAARRDLDALAGQLAPDSLTLLRLRAWHALATADAPRARDLYEQILNRVADDENAAINLSVLDARDGRMDSARERLRRLLSRNPGSPQIASALRSMDERP